MGWQPPWSRARPEGETAMESRQHQRETIALVIGGAIILCLCAAAVLAGVLVIQALFGVRLF